ncbi:hypothetical protein PROFUN_02112 [Planoprotostelium fungivorum]|uniref:Uncharacterized protein n=1 Tax=Planoprotostelium fungivorum TaxID=1890364 RepID=A0A2P6NZ95_9EUKA|nr:hypothetical protein PROFUN_02112 [Planoprotostelium fungivorum]
MAAAKASIKVKCLPGSSQRTKMLMVSEGTTVEQILKDLPQQPLSDYSTFNPCVLMIPETPLRSLWPTNDNKVPPVSAGKVVECSRPPSHSHQIAECRRLYQTIRIQHQRKQYRILISINQPFKDILPQLADRVGVSDIQRYSLCLRNGEDIQLDKSIREQSLNTDRIFFLLSPEENRAAEFATEEEPVEEGEEEDHNTPIRGGRRKLFGNSSREELKDNALKMGSMTTRPDPREKYKQLAATITKDGYLVLKLKGEKKVYSQLKLSDFNLKENFEFAEEAVEKDPMRETTPFSFGLLPKDRRPQSPNPAAIKTRLDTNPTTALECRFETQGDMKSWVNAIRAQMNEENKPNQGGIFGAPLDRAVGKYEIPYIVKVCTEFIEGHALKLEGIFRLSGSQVQIDQLRAAFDAGEQVVLDKDINPHTVAGLMKLYFRNLPEPLLTFPLYSNFIGAQSAPNRSVRLRSFRSLVEILPRNNYNLLKYLLVFLIEVSKHSAVNKMGVPNLATVFAPNLLTTADGDMGTMVQDTAQINAVVGTLIQDFQEIFENKDLNEDVAVVQYDFAAENDNQLSLKVGDMVTVIMQGENGWWSGEFNGKVGNFPGSYVKLETKTRKAKFMEDMTRAKKKLEEETTQVANLSATRDSLEKEIEQITAQKAQLQQKIIEARKQCLRRLAEADSKGQLLPRVLMLVDKLEMCKKEFSREVTNNEIITEVESLKRTLHDPAELRKTIKVKDSAKLEPSLEAVEIKLREEVKQREVAGQRTRELLDDLLFLRDLDKK